MPGPNSTPKARRGGHLIIGKSALKRAGVASGSGEERENPISKPSRTPERQAVVESRREKTRNRKAGRK
jgi:hypothetical protein